MKLLLAKTHSEDTNQLAGRLIGMGHVVISVYDGLAAFELAARYDFDAAIVDHCLPVTSGLEVCRSIKSRLKRPASVVMTCAAGELEKRIASFDAGADDHLDQPFAVEELAARLKVLCRPLTRHHDEVIRVGDLEIFPAELKVRLRDQAIDLSGTPFKLLKILADRSPRVVMNSDLGNLIHGPGRADVRSIASHMTRLRARLNKPAGRTTIVNHRSIGYRLIGE